MVLKTPSGRRTHRVRHARAADLAHLADVEASGGQQYVDAFGPDLNPILLSPPATGAFRASQPGFLLVAVPTDGDGPPVGFAHVLVIDGHAHLEQLSVRPQVQRQGLGSALVHAAMDEARAGGYPSMSLCTYRDVPFNGPFYAELGFVEVTELAPYQQRLHDHELAIGLAQDGVRVVMQVALREQVTGGQLKCAP